MTMDDIKTLKTKTQTKNDIPLLEADWKILKFVHAAGSEGARLVDISSALGMAQPTAKFHLFRLMSADALRSTRPGVEGTQRRYWLTKNVVIENGHVAGVDSVSAEW